MAAAASVWPDILATIRFVAGQVLPVVTAVGAIAATYYAYKSKAIGTENSDRLVKQDTTIHAIKDKVVALADSPTPDDLLRRRVEGLADQLAAIRKESGSDGP